MDDGAEARSSAVLEGLQPVLAVWRRNAAQERVQASVMPSRRGHQGEQVIARQAQPGPAREADQPAGVRQRLRRIRQAVRRRRRPGSGNGTTPFTEGFDTADLKDAKALLDELA